MVTGVKMSEIPPIRFRLRPDVKELLDQFIAAHPHVSQTDLVNDGLVLEIARRRSLEPKSVKENAA